MDNATRLERLQLLKTVLGEIREDVGEAFDMGAWAQHRGTGTPHLDANMMPGCGTACCALGYAAMRPEFIALGLVLETSIGKYLQHGTPTLGDVDGFAAAAALFGITGSESIRLFDPPTYDVDFFSEIRPAHVIARIDALISKYSENPS